MVATPFRLLVMVVGSSLVLGCPKRSDAPSGAPSASASASAIPAPIASGVPIDPMEVSRAVNPEGKPAYSGPVGIVEGRIVATGDKPVEQPEIAKDIPANCAGARPFYATAFREGEGRALADVLVAVTGYTDYVPAHEPAQRFVAKGCTFATRTIALTFGQRLEIVSGDREAYIPELVGERGQAQIVATPGGSVASTIYPTRAGRFVLVDNLKLFMTAEVLVLKYATVAVTGIDGRYRISGVPPGSLRLSAILPSTGRTTERTVVIEGGKTASVDLEIPFDAKLFREALDAKRAAAERLGADAGAAPDAGSAPPARPKAPKPASSQKP